MNHRLRTWCDAATRLFFLAILALGCIAASHGADKEESRAAWFKGSTHMHSLWSDCDQLPEMVAQWYKSHGYQFIAMSDHNLLMRGERWYKLKDKKRPVTPEMLDACRKQFGDGWVDLRGEDDRREVRLKTLDEIRPKLEQPGKFLMIENEEITGKCGNSQVHVNAINIAEAIKPASGSSVADTLRLDLEAIAQQSKRLKRPILGCVNHPNWKWFDVSADDLAAATAARFFEVCNSLDVCNNGGYKDLPSTERVWDAANTIRIAKLKAPPLYAVASDDTHHCRVVDGGSGQPGRGWIQVRADKLATESILAALSRGDFYASNGVTLRNVAYDKRAGTLSVEVQPEAGVKYTIEFIGTLAGYNPATEPLPVLDKEGKLLRTAKKYSADVGKVLAQSTGTRASYKLTGKELYVRAVVRSDKSAAGIHVKDPVSATAWCQPVGWEKQVK